MEDIEVLAGEEDSAVDAADLGKIIVDAVDLSVVHVPETAAHKQKATLLKARGCRSGSRTGADSRGKSRE